MRPFLVLLVASAAACHPSSNELSRPATSPRVVERPGPAARRPAPPPRPTYDEVLESLFGGGDGAPDATPPPHRPDHERFPEEVAAARSRARVALEAAQIGHLHLSETMVPVRESDRPTTWRFALMDPNPCEGACRQLDEGEQVGWLLVPVGGEVSAETLGHTYDLVGFARVRAREEQQARRLAKLPVMESFCRWVVQQGAEACTMWLEQAPASDCARSCQWQAYVGASNGMMSSRHFTLLIDEQAGALTVRRLDGTTEPMTSYRRRLGF